MLSSLEMGRRCYFASELIRSLVVEADEGSAMGQCADALVGNVSHNPALASGEDIP